MSERSVETLRERRGFLTRGTLVLAAAVMGSRTSGVGAALPNPVRFGLMTDLHYADKAPAGTRHYRETPEKLATVAERFANEKLQFVVELGDLIDAADSVDVELNYLRTINRQFSEVHRDRHYVLGNHCVDMLRKAEFLDAVEQPRSYYAFDRGGVHFVVLDACFRSDGEPYGRRNAHWTDANVPAAELEWLADDLQENRLPVVVLAHQRLDVANPHGVKNQAAVRQILETSGRVLAVFQGHSHQNDVRTIQGIHYCTLVAMVEGAGLESNGAAVVEIAPDGTIRLTGLHRQQSHTWERPA